MAFKKYIKGILKPEVAKRAKAMKTAKRERIRASNRQIDYGELEKKIGYVFDDKSILKEALTHPGAVGFSKGKVKSNQRLEFLGDAVLQSSITDIVFRKFDTYDEGALTKIRIALTQGSFLSELSQSLEIPKYLILPKGSEHLREMASAAEDAFEALVGAVYLDSNFEKARKTIYKWYKQRLEDLHNLVEQQNPKGALQELAAKHGESVAYSLLSQSGPDHSKVFEVEVAIGGISFGKASASSKKSAETKAARMALGAYAKLFPGNTDAGEEEKKPAKPKAKKAAAKPAKKPSEKDA